MSDMEEHQEQQPAKRIRKSTDKDYQDELLQAPARPKIVKRAKPKPQQHQRIVRQQYNSFDPVLIDPDIYIPSSVTLSTYDKAPQLILSSDRLSCSGSEAGYRTIRATHGVHRGSYYYEVEIQRSNAGAQNLSVKLAKNPRNGHIRIGWSTRQGDLQAPIGFDHNSFAYRDEQGSKVHKSIREDNYGEPFGEGDIIGCHISLFDDVNLNKMNFYKNGTLQGTAFSSSEIPNNIFFPAISLYMKAEFRVNFGPTFIIKPDIPGVNAVSELQPMSSEDRKVHDQLIAAIKRTREERVLSATS